MSFFVSTGCRPGEFGPNCQSVCECQNGGQCDDVTGVCICLLGWIGATCEQPCPPGRYGLNCSELCQCQNGGVCDSRSGRCACPAGTMGKNCEKGNYLKLKFLKYVASFQNMYIYFLA